MAGIALAGDSLGVRIAVGCGGEWTMITVGCGEPEGAESSVVDIDIPSEGELGLGFRFVDSIGVRIALGGDSLGVMIALGDRIGEG